MNRMTATACFRLAVLLREGGGIGDVTNAAVGVTRPVARLRLAALMFGRAYIWILLGQTVSGSPFSISPALTFLAARLGFISDLLVSAYSFEIK